MKRRDFLRGVAGMAAGAPLSTVLLRNESRAEPAPPRGAGGKMNVIVIVADSLRPDHLGCYGSRVKTPNLDAFAKDSARFTEYYGENLPTIPCRSSWWTGQYLFAQRGWQPFTGKDLLLAEVLWQHDVASALVTDTYHMHKPVYNCGRGFDTTVFIRGQEYDPWVVDESIPVDLGVHHRLRGDDKDPAWRQRFGQYLRNRTRFQTEEDYPAPRVVKEAIRWLEDKTRSQKQSLFLWVDLFDPHEPWDPPAPYRELYDPGYTGQELIDPVPGMVEGYMTPREVEHTKALYAGEVSFVDKWVGVLLQRIKDLGLYENSLILFMSDHGEPFGEHGFIRKAFPRGYEELAHIPLLLRHPDGHGRGKQIGAFVQPPDILPTVLDCLGVSTKLTLQYTAPVDLTFPQDVVVSTTPVHILGKSLLPLLKGQVEGVRDFAVTAHYQQQWVLRTKDHAYHHHPTAKRPNELYDRRQDRAEKHNLIEREPELADHLQTRLKEFVKSIS
jgi:arylsulfatase A-like enzyme